MVHILRFDGEREDLYVTEFGHHRVDRVKTVGPRVRREFLLHFVVTGECCFSDFTVPAGDAFFIARGVRHSFSIAPGYEHFWIGFGGSGAEKLLEAWGVDPRCHCSFPGGATVAQALLALGYDRCRQKLGERSALSTLMGVLPLLVAKKPVVWNDVQRAKRFMDNNYYERITMLQVADYVSLSEKHLCRKFRRVYGLPPQKYLLQVRMEKARKLLRESELMVKEVAQSVGYESLLGFSEMYRRYFGISPSLDRLAEVKGTTKTSNAHLSADIDTVEGEL